PLFHVAHDADDFRRGTDDLQVDALADGIFVAECEAREFLVNYDYRRGMQIVVRGEKAPAKKTDLHRLQIVGLDGIKQRVLHVGEIRWRWLALDPGAKCGGALRGSGGDFER